jgi:hypothetical protein
LGLGVGLVVLVLAAKTAAKAFDAFAENNYQF